MKVTTLKLMHSLSLQSDLSVGSVSDDIDSVKTPTNSQSITDIFHKYGYTKRGKICDTLQGELIKAAINGERDNYVAIKRTNKCLFKKRIAVEDNINFCVSENIEKEALILKYLTVDNTPLGKYVVQYVDFFQSETDYFLVMEYVENGTNLKTFLAKARQYIKNGKLCMKSYQKMMKYLLWQLAVTLEWLHSSMHCCHLDLCVENILVSNAEFIETNDSVSIHPNISIKLADFGVSDLFKVEKQSTANYLCEKQGLSIEHEQYFAPKVFNGDIFDARFADNWSFGMVLFECMTVGKQLYRPSNMYHPQSGYIALYQGTLRQYLVRNDLLTYFTSESFLLLRGLLNVNDLKRLKANDILKHKWFSVYFKKYQHRIFKKYVVQKQKLTQQQESMNEFPFYH